MSWVKIEFRKEQMKANRKCRAEQIDYEKIREITREVVKEEMTVLQSNQPTPLTKEDLLETVSEAILLADKKRDEEKKNRIKKAKLSKFTIGAMVFFVLVALFFAVMAVAIFVTANGNLVMIADGIKLVVVAMTYATVVFLLYAVGKRNDENYTFNAITILFGLVSLVVTLVQQGG